MRQIPAYATVAAIGVLSVLFAAASDSDKRPSALRLLHTRTPLHGLVLGSETIERGLARGDDHLYQVALEAGEYVRVTVEQKGIDLIVETRDPAGEAIVDFDDDLQHGGAEQIDLVATTRGTYSLVVEPPVEAVAQGTYAIRIDARRPATDGDRWMQESRRLRTTAARLETEGRFDQARLQLEQALTLARAASGPDDVQVAAVEARLAGVYRRLPDRPESEALYRRALAILDRALGPEHPATAVVRSQLAGLYYDEGDHPRAEALLRQSMAVLDQALGPGDRRIVDCLITLGDLRGSAGDLNAAEAIIQRALSILKRIDATDSRQYAALLNNLGEVYRQKTDYENAEALFRQALALDERLLGPDNYFVATPLQNLGIVARERKDYATAVAYNERALLIRQRAVGLDHPDVAHILTNLANIYRATGDYARALDTHLRALGIWQNAAGPYQDATLLSVGNIAKTYAAQGDVANAVAYERWADAIVEKQLALNLAVGSERRKLALVRSVSERTDRTISLHLDQAPADPGAASLALLVLLQRKGRVQDAMTDLFAAARRRADRQDRALLDRLNTIQARLAQLALRPPEDGPPDVRRHTLAGLESQNEQLEATLTEHNAEFRAQTQPVTVEAVQAAIPEDAALLEFAVFRPFDPAAERNADAYGTPRYAAYVLRRHAAPIGFDLGDAAVINHSIEAFRDALRNPAATDVDARARAVDERTVRPLRAALGDATRLIISADGELNLVPFEALVDERGRYLIDRFSMSYVTSGRDLLRMQVPRGAPSRPVIVADPLFGEPASDDLARRSSLMRTGPRPPVTTGADLSAVYFAPLAATETEAHAIQALFPGAMLLTGSRATKSSVQRLRAPRLLHVASHGFFLDDGALGASRDIDRNPLLRSGLAFAGANLTGHGRDDGILTALEASSLDLWGTKLVTLSACDTGIGEIRNGEGVYGLRRAFVLAGAETLVMSLWPVSDFVARDTMVAYYAGLRAGLGRGDALRRAKRAIRKRRPHPYFWAAFIQSGEWTRLDGRRPRHPRSF